MSVAINDLLKLYEEIDHLAVISPFAYLQATRSTQLIFLLALPFVIFAPESAESWRAAAQSWLCFAVNLVFFSLDEVSGWMELPFGDSPSDVDVHKWTRRVSCRALSPTHVLCTCSFTPVLCPPT